MFRAVMRASAAAICCARPTRFYRQGDERGDNAALRSAIEVYGRALAEYPRERVPLDWAATQNNLGIALADARRAGERDGAARGGGRGLSRGAGGDGRASGFRSTGRRRRTISAMRSASARRAGERDGAARGGGRGLSRGAGGTDARAGAARLGGDAEQSRHCALRALGERESGTARLEEAVAAYRAALEEWTRERVPLDWAMTQNNLGNALASARRAGERDGAARGGGRGLSRGAGGMDARAGAARLGDDAEQSRQCARERSASGRAGRRGWRRRSRPIARRWRRWTRERVPLDWAMTQNNLGNALWTLGERESGTARLEEAVAAYRAALEERTRERVPLEWATTQNNLGNALRDARRAGERDGAARGGGRGLSRGAGGMDARAGAARLGDDAEQSRQRALERSASGRAGRRGWRRRSRPIARRWRNGRASGCRSTGR